MKSLIDVFRMDEVDQKTRAKIIIQLGHAINAQYGMNITEPLVYELVSKLDAENRILQDDHYIRLISV